MLAIWSVKTVVILDVEKIQEQYKQIVYLRLLNNFLPDNSSVFSFCKQEYYIPEPHSVLESYNFKYTSIIKSIYLINFAKNYPPQTQIKSGRLKLI